MMKNYLLASALLFSFFSFSQQTEDVEENRRWDISMSYKLGHGKQYSDVYRGLNGSVTASDILLTYTFLTPNTNSYFRVSSGISMIEFNTNFMYSEFMVLNSLATHQSRYLQVPLRVGSQIGMFNQDVVRLVADFGFAGNYHLETIFETRNEQERIWSGGWTFAFISTIGFDANVTRRLKVGVIADLHSPIISDDAEKNRRLPLQAQLIGINFRYML